MRCVHCREGRKLTGLSTATFVFYGEGDEPNVYCYSCAHKFGWHEEKDPAHTHLVVRMTDIHEDSPRFKVDLGERTIIFDLSQGSLVVYDGKGPRISHVDAEMARMLRVLPTLDFTSGLAEPPQIQPSKS